MDYSFNIDLAKTYGVEEAVLLNHLYYWIQHNAANGKHLHDGRYWTYNSAQAFTEIFPFWNRKKIDRLIQNLKDSGAVIIGNYNEDARDRTRWFALSENVLCIVENRPTHWTETSNECPENVQPLPDSKPVIKPNKKQENVFAPPTLQAVREYAESMHLDIDPSKFMSYYDASDWHDSQGKKVRNWKQKAITWSGRNKGKPEPKKEVNDADRYAITEGFKTSF